MYLFAIQLVPQNLTTTYTPLISNNNKIPPGNICFCTSR